MTGVTARKRADHYLPAALIGGFGIRETRPGKTGLRFATVSVRDHDHPDEVKRKRAENVANKVGEYWVAHPPPGYSRNFIDEHWDQYEPQLPAAVQRLGDRIWTERDWGTVLQHVVAEAVRNPDFERTATDYRAAKGTPIKHRDDVQHERLVTLANTPPLLARARFAVVRTPEDGHRFVINDKGFTTVADPYIHQKGVLFPLSGVVAETCDPLLVIGHPDDEERIARLDDSPLIFPTLGPYRNKGMLGAFEWAYDDTTSALAAPGGP